MCKENDGEEVRKKRTHSEEGKDECYEFKRVKKNDEILDDPVEQNLEVNCVPIEENQDEIPEVSLKKKFKLLLRQIKKISRQLALGTLVESTENMGNENDDEMYKCSERFMFRETPPFINGKMRDYQIHGLNWMITLRENNINGILADEMGLGKTLQTVSLLGYIKYFENKKDTNLPSLIIVPATVICTWRNEITKWIDGMQILFLHGGKNHCKEIVKNDLKKGGYDIVLTTYEILLKFCHKLKIIEWDYIIIDEAHRIKNGKSITSKAIRYIKSKNRLLLTGTPLQNNLYELWSLLNFIQPELFDDAEDFENWFCSDKCFSSQNSTIKKLHKILNPFILRRIKKDVEKKIPPKIETTLFVGLSNIQKKLYKKCLLNGAEVFINGKIKRGKFMNLFQQLRKIASHPYLLPGVEPGPPYEEGEHVIKCCGKLRVLDKLLTKLKSQGSRVIIFAQFLDTLNILEDYMIWKNYSYNRFDGKSPYNERQEYIDEFQSEESTTFAMLLSTRAGGIGITLTAADVVIFYDIDWNPQMDLQAADRVHRIGQKKQVKIFRLIAEGTVDEEIYKVAEKKLHLDNLVIQKGRMNEMKREMKQEEIMRILRNDIEEVGNLKKGKFKYNIEEIVERSSLKYKKIQDEINGISKSQSNIFLETHRNSNSRENNMYHFNGNDYKILQKNNNDQPEVEYIKKKRLSIKRFENLN
ncbi:SWI/SNF-related matrix-associated actin-dependent regulator of chromatin subfamily A member 5 [Strongyloides ratti]|uniref:SWI/SNF-related matrix-associated actin-dependent regulator of chromatin subfamily A member 5 n=1 Tax=Strongyloides ratti TaxID=34506 RepID=A0A090L9E9_STRRB|nr:SWI/SNF-related matrix-associated actin-dependent regulator of chromatin subfamily A member 5 [Strongyloides ratti]CEF64135.1 SWI/SNF-related matrix-associated actin-dependent regulator of chromatin subfamily A member 5 [Strongyloides ratti]